MSPVKRRRVLPEGRRARIWFRLRYDRRVHLALGAAVVLVVLLGLWVAHTLQAARSDLFEARRQAQLVQEALGQGDVDRAHRAAVRLDAALDSADDRTHGPTWGVIGRTPLFGDDLRGIATASAALHDLSTDGVLPLVEKSQRLDAGAFAPRDHVFPLARIAALRTTTTEVSRAFVRASDQLAEVDSTGFVGPLRRQFDQLRDLVDHTSGYIDTARRATQIMPDFLGADGPRNYLFVFQNNAELRATGGLPGALSLVHAEDGRVEITTQASSADFREREKPVVPLTRDEQQVYGPQLGTYFLDANFLPDFPRAAQLWRARWVEHFGGRVDGIFVVDPVAISYLLTATGPIDVGGLALTAQNLVATVENRVYINVADLTAQDDFFKLIARRAFDVFADGQGDQAGLVKGLARGVAEGRVRLHSFVERDQRQIDGTQVAAEFPVTASTDPQVGVYLNDGTGAKMSYYLDYRASVSAISCRRGVQRLAGSFRVTSATPDDIATLPPSVTGVGVPNGVNHEAGEQILVADIFAPVDGRILQVSYNGEREAEPLITTFRGRQLLSVGINLKPQGTLRVDFTMVTGRGQTGPTHVDVTPGSRPGSTSSIAPSGCH